MKNLSIAIACALAATAAFAETMSTDTKAQWQELSRRIETMRRESKSLDESMSHEARLAVIDAALADARWKDRHGWLKQRRFDALSDLGRDAEAEAYLLQLQGAAVDDRERAGLSEQLGNFYISRAPRYCSKPDAKTLTKAAAQYRKVVALSEKDASRSQRMLQKIAECHYRAGDFAAARQALDEETALVEKLHERTRPQVSEAIAVLRGDMLFDEKDFAGALGQWLPYGESLKKTNAARLERVCRAFSGAGRRAEMLPYLEALAKKGNKYTRLRYEYNLDLLKKEIGECGNEKK